MSLVHHFFLVFFCSSGPGGRGRRRPEFIPLWRRGSYFRRALSGACTHRVVIVFVLLNLILVAAPFFAQLSAEQCLVLGRARVRAAAAAVCYLSARVCACLRARRCCQP